MRYGRDLGCRFGQPHDFKIIHETPHVKWEQCTICRLRKRYNKGYRGRVNNTEYLKDHVRNFAQRGGATKGIYNKVYQRENCIITI